MCYTALCRFSSNEQGHATFITPRTITKHHVRNRYSDPAILESGLHLPHLATDRRTCHHQHHHGGGPQRQLKAACENIKQTYHVPPCYYAVHVPVLAQETVRVLYRTTDHRRQLQVYWGSPRVRHEQRLPPTTSNTS